MDSKKKYRWAIAGLIIMVLLNVATLFTIWTNTPRDRIWQQHRSGESNRTTVHRFMKKELGLTETQADSMASLRRQHFREMKELRDDLATYRKDYFNFIMSENSENAQRRDSLLSQLTNQYIEVEEAVYTHISEMKTILNPDQQKKFKELMGETILQVQRKDHRYPQR